MTQPATRLRPAARFRYQAIKSKGQAQHLALIINHTYLEPNYKGTPNLVDDPGIGIVYCGLHQDDL